MKRYLGVVAAAALLAGMPTVETDALAVGQGGGGFGGGGSIETESPRVIRHACKGVTDKDKRKPIQSKAILP